MKSSTDDDVSTEAGESDAPGLAAPLTYSRDALLAFRPRPAPGLAAPRMYQVQPRPRDFGLETEVKGEWSGKQWTGYHVKQARLAARRAEEVPVKS